MMNKNKQDDIEVYIDIDYNDRYIVVLQSIEDKADIFNIKSTTYGTYNNHKKAKEDLDILKEKDNDTLKKIKKDLDNLPKNEHQLNTLEDLNNHKKFKGLSELDHVKVYYIEQDNQIKIILQLVEDSNIKRAVFKGYNKYETLYNKDEILDEISEQIKYLQENIKKEELRLKCFKKIEQLQNKTNSELLKLIDNIKNNDQNKNIIKTKIKKNIMYDSPDNYEVKIYKKDIDYTELEFYPTKKEAEERSEEIEKLKTSNWEEITSPRNIENKDNLTKNENQLNTSKGVENIITKEIREYYFEQTGVYSSDLDIKNYYLNNSKKSNQLVNHLNSLKENVIEILKNDNKLSFLYYNISNKDNIKNIPLKKIVSYEKKDFENLGLFLNDNQIFIINNYVEEFKKEHKESFKDNKKITENNDNDITM